VHEGAPSHLRVERGTVHDDVTHTESTQGAYPVVDPLMVRWTVGGVGNRTGGGDFRVERVQGVNARGPGEPEIGVVHTETRDVCGIVAGHGKPGAGRDHVA